MKSMPPVSRKPAGTGSRRYDTIVFLLLLCLLIVAGSGVARYVYIDRPAARAQKESQLLMQRLMEENHKNQQQLELRLAEAKAQTEALRANMEQIKAESQQAKAVAAAEPVPEPAAKPVAADTQAAERKRLERARAADDLVESLAPKLQVRFDPKVAWLDHSVSFAFSLTNAGRRAIRVAQPRIALNLHPLPNMRPSALALKSGDVQVEVCPAGLIGPGETLNCSGVLRAEASFTGVGHISFRALLSARTDIPASGEAWKTMRATYKVAELESRMAKDVPVSGDLWR